MTSAKHLPAIVLAVVIASVIVFSSLYIAMEAGHDCTGETCPICEQVSVCEGVLKRIMVTVVAVALIAERLYCLSVGLLNSFSAKVPSTLVSLKIKLSN